MKDDDSIEITSKLPLRVEPTMLEILNRRRFDNGDDPLADAFRRFIRRRP